MLAGVGCSTQKYVGVGFDQGSQSLTFYIPLCGQQDLSELRVTTSGDSEDEYRSSTELWRIRSQVDHPRTAQVDYGTTPIGYSQEDGIPLDALLDRYADVPLRVVATKSGESSALAIFTINDLPRDGSINFSDSGPQRVPRADVGAALRDQCSNSQFGAVGILGLAATATVAALTTIYVFVVRRRARVH
jgi:hypothetical protein